LFEDPIFAENMEINPVLLQSHDPGIVLSAIWYFCIINKTYSLFINP